MAGVAYLIVGVLASTAYFTVPGLEGNGLLFGLIGFSAAVAIVVGMARNRPRQVLPWALFAAAQVSFVAGDFPYYTFHFEFPSPGDMFYLAVYPLLVGGLLLLIRSRSAGRDRASLLDASIITVGLGLLAWVFLIEPYTHLEGLRTVERLMSMAYPLMDVLLLAVAARLAIGSGTRPASFYLICLGIVSLLATDSAYGYIETAHGLHPGRPPRRRLAGLLPPVGHGGPPAGYAAAGGPGRTQHAHRHRPPSRAVGCGDADRPWRGDHPVADRGRAPVLGLRRCIGRAVPAGNGPHDGPGQEPPIEHRRRAPGAVP